jgi:hypothetical protein
VNAAGTIGMTLDGYIYEQDWEALALAGGVIPSAYNYSANVALDGVNGWLAMSAEGAWIVHGAATYDTAVSNATVGMTSGSYGGGGALLAISPVVQSTLRLTWDDPLGLTIIGGGAGDGTDIDAFYTEKIWTGQWPVGADTLTIEQLQLGPGIGQSCSQNVQLVVGNQCCAVLIPGVPDLPPGTIDCLLTAQLKVWHLDDCAGGTGIGLAVAGSVQKTENCPDIGTTFGYALDVMYFEEYDPTNFPDSFAMVRYVKNAIVPVAWTADPTPYAFNHLVSTQDPLGTNPNVGTPRGSNGINPLARKWYARVIMRSLTNRNTVGSLDTAIITSPAYGWCP